MKMPDTTINLGDLVWLIEQLQRQAAALSSGEQARLHQIIHKADLAEEDDIAGHSRRVPALPAVGDSFFSASRQKMSP